MPVDVLVETTIARSPAVVSSFAGNPTNATKWYSNIKSVTWQTPPPVAIGSLMEFEAHFLGRRLVYTYEIVGLVLGERLVMQTADGPFPTKTTYTWEPCDLGTRMTLRNRGEPSGFARVAAPVMERAMRRATSKDLARLKSILEGPQGADLLMPCEGDTGAEIDSALPSEPFPCEVDGLDEHRLP